MPFATCKRQRIMNREMSHGKVHKRRKRSWSAITACRNQEQLQRMEGPVPMTEARKITYRCDLNLGARIFYSKTNFAISPICNQQDSKCTIQKMRDGLSGFIIQISLIHFDSSVVILILGLTYSFIYRTGIGWPKRIIWRKRVTNESFQKRARLAPAAPRQIQTKKR